MEWDRQGKLSEAPGTFWTLGRLLLQALWWNTQAAHLRVPQSRALQPQRGAGVTIHVPLLQRACNQGENAGAVSSLAVANTACVGCAGICMSPFANDKVLFPSVSQSNYIRIHTGHPQTSLCTSDSCSFILTFSFI